MPFRLTGATLEMLLIAQMYPEGAPWPPPARLRYVVEPLLVAGFLVREDDRVVLSAEGGAAVAGDERSVELREELIASEAAHQSLSEDGQSDPAVDDRSQALRPSKGRLSLLQGRLQGSQS